MNLEHFRAFLWLRWRLRINQMRRAGGAAAVLFAALVGLVLFLSAVLFVLMLLLGAFALGDKSPAAILYTWDGLVAGFLFFWMAGLIADLQRAEPLSLSKFLHLPVSPTGAFVINYLSSLLSATLILFTSAMLGLSTGLVISRGPALLVQFPLILAFLLAVTALTYQFQGWLAALMSNPRRRRTIIVVATGVFILLCQVPNLLNLSGFWKNKIHSPAETPAWYTEQKAALSRDLASKKLTAEEYHKQTTELDARRKSGDEEAQRQSEDGIYQAFRVGNVFLPPGWLPLGVSAAAESSFLPGLMGTIGLGLIGGASLWRAYRTTLRLYTGQFTSGKEQSLPAEVPPPAPTPAGEKPGRRLLDRDLPWVSEQAAAIALGSFASFLRAPESKMMLLTPILFALIFGTMLFTNTKHPDERMVPLMAFGGMAMVLLSSIQLAGNLFGFDRGGFRVYVLGPAPRREVLLGKNLAFAPLPLTLGLLVLGVLAAVYRMRIDHLLAMPAMMLSMFLLFILMANWLSILAPIPIAAGSFKPSNPKLIPMLLHLLFLFLFPLALLPSLMPLGVEVLCEEMGWVRRGIPVCLGLSLLVCPAVVLLYRAAVGWQGQLLHAREKHILGVVTATKD